MCIRDSINAEYGEPKHCTMEEEPEVLQARIATFKEQLQQVESALALDPDNEQMVKLRIDLLQVIELTTELLASTAQQGEPMPDEPEQGHEVGDIVSAWYQASESWEAAEIDAVTSEGNYAITYIGYPSDSAEVTPTQVTRFKPVAFDIGDKIMAVWEKDGTWYQAVVKAQEPTGYKVMFEKYGLMSVVPPTHVKAKREKVGGKRQRGIREVPDNLKVLLTDSEEVKNQKRKKVKAIKTANRNFEKDEEQNARQNTWRSFQSKPKKKITGFFINRTGDSMFKSPTTVDGKVGVVMQNETDRITHYDDTQRIWAKKDDE
eukprot:TRINITY_DN18933_c0_g1_i1.p1 TRINITY_DN18933_c0_g1~~TRINITY_DN18933_c0_g1_i1.p1  ORF type:complete len:318 (+),score=89.42 TRINITY_DN18933_c0_g1_i1:147-1100(+)